MQCSFSDPKFASSRNLPLFSPSPLLSPVLSHWLDTVLCWSPLPFLAVTIASTCLSHWLSTNSFIQLSEQALSPPDDAQMVGLVLESLSGTYGTCHPRETFARSTRRWFKSTRPSFVFLVWWSTYTSHASQPPRFLAWFWLASDGPALLVRSLREPQHRSFHHEKVHLTYIRGCQTSTIWNQLSNFSVQVKLKRSSVRFDCKRGVAGTCYIVLHGSHKDCKQVVRIHSSQFLALMNQCTHCICCIFDFISDSRYPR